MKALRNVTAPTELSLLVAFFDLTLFARFSRTLNDGQLFDFVSEYYEFTSDCIENSGGMIVKFMGDAGLVVYPDEDLDRAVLGLMGLKQTGDAWLDRHGAACRHVIKAHYGPVVCGLVGGRTDKRFDVFGQTVHTAALLPSHGFAMTPELFRKLGHTTRTGFKKHTPPITYIPVEQRHRE